MKTARYSNPRVADPSCVPIAVSLGAPKFPLRYRVVATCMTLAPTREILAIDDKERYRAKYRARLDAIGVDSIRAALAPFETPDREIVLLCFEDLREPGRFCHRRFFAEWWEERTGERVEELAEPCEREARQGMLF